MSVQSTRRYHAVFIATIIAATLLRTLCLDIIPAGSDGDAAWIGINALDWVDRQAWPYYVRELYEPAPISVYLTGLSILLTGISNLTMRLVTALSGVLMVVLLFPTTSTLLTGQSEKLRLRAGLLASLAGAVSLHAVYVSRLGLQAPILPLFVVLMTWMIARAWLKGGQQRWAMAGVGLALTQYIYTSGRVIPFVIVLWFIHACLLHREQFRRQWRGWITLAVVALLLVTPNLYLFLTAPGAFNSRVDAATGYTGSLIWTQDLGGVGGVLSLIARKLLNNIIALGIAWNGPYTAGIGQPILTPVFAVGLVISLIQLFRRPQQIALAWSWLTLPIVLIPDLISSISASPHAMRQISMLPFIFMLSGIGLAYAWQAADPYIRGNVRYILYSALTILIIVPSAAHFYRYVFEFVPAQYADPDTAWLREQTDLDISRHIASEPEHSYLILATEYDRSNIAWHTATAFRYRHSSISNDITLKFTALPSKITIVMPADPFRVRRDARPAQLDTRLWVLLHQGETLLLPPLSAEAERRLSGLIAHTGPELLYDRSETVIARFYTIPTDGLLPETISFTSLNTVLNDEIALVGYTTSSLDLIPGDVSFFTLYWQALTHPHEDYEIFIQLWNDRGEAVSQWQNVPYSGMYRTRIWQIEEIVPTHHWLQLPDDLPPGRYRLVAGLFRTLHRTRLLVTGSEALPDYNVALVGEFRVPLPPAQEYGEPPSAPIVFGDMLSVIGLNIAVDGNALKLGESWTVCSGQQLEVAITWKALKPTSVDYTAFLHLTASDDSTPLAQIDIPIGGSYPTGIWRHGEIVRAPLELRIPDDLPAGNYQIWLGAYYWATGERLSVTAGNQIQVENRLFAGRIIVPPASC